MIHRALRRQGCLSSLDGVELDFDWRAFKHGCLEEDIRHALGAGLLRLKPHPDPDVDPPQLLVIGLDTNARALELIIYRPDTAPRVMHAMPLRPAFRRFFDPGGDPHA